MTEMARERSWIAELSVAVRELLSHLPANRRPPPERVVVRYEPDIGKLELYVPETRFLAVLRPEGIVEVRRPVPFHPDLHLFFLAAYRHGEQIGETQIEEANVR
jgi:hypothetical protein